MNTEGKKNAFPRRSRTYSRPAASSGSQLRFIVTVIVMTLVGTAGAFAHGQIHRQIDSATGITTYLYRPSSADRRLKASSPPVSRRRSDKAFSHTVLARPKTQLKQVPADGITLSSYQNFPRVSAETQKARDLERSRILKHELAWEQAALDQAIENQVASDVLRRHKENIEALHREIRNVQ